VVFVVTLIFWGVQAIRGMGAANGTSQPQRVWQTFLSFYCGWLFVAVSLCILAIPSLFGGMRAMHEALLLHAFVAVLCPGGNRWRGGTLLYYFSVVGSVSLSEVLIFWSLRCCSNTAGWYHCIISYVSQPSQSCPAAHQPNSL
jgi:hypothetical protein